MNAWLDHYRRIYYPLLNIQFDGVQGVLTDGMYNRAVGFDIIFRLLLNQKKKVTLTLLKQVHSELRATGWTVRVLDCLPSLWIFMTGKYAV